MTKAPISLQDLRRSLYVKAKAEPSWRFWGLYVHVCKMETLREAYQMAKSNDGAPGIDGVTFEAIQESGAESLLVQIRDELVTNRYLVGQLTSDDVPDIAPVTVCVGVKLTRNAQTVLLKNSAGSRPLRMEWRLTGHLDVWDA